MIEEWLKIYGTSTQGNIMQPLKRISTKYISWVQGISMMYYYVGKNKIKWFNIIYNISFLESNKWSITFYISMYAYECVYVCISLKVLQSYISTKCLYKSMIKKYKEGTLNANVGHNAI